MHDIFSLAADLAPLTQSQLCCWVITGLSWSGTALQGYRRSFFSVKGLVATLRGHHYRDPKIRLILRTQLCCRWGYRQGSEGGPSPLNPPCPRLPFTDCGPAEVLGSVSSVLWKTIQHWSVLQKSVIENNIFFLFPENNLLHNILFSLNM